MQVLENSRVLDYLKKRGLIKQYKKARTDFEKGHLDKIKLKKRKLLA